MNVSCHECVEWQAMLLVALSQLGKLLAMHTGGAVGILRQLRRRRKVSQGRIGGRGGRAVQQWWRQLRSYVHQQRCGWTRTKVEAGAEELQGAAAGGAALEATVPAIRARRGGRGWSDDRMSSWRWWQRVLLLLVWLVVPVEAGFASQTEKVGLQREGVGAIENLFQRQIRLCCCYGDLVCT